MNNDFNSPVAIANLFDAVKIMNAIKEGKETISADDLIHLKETFDIFLSDILGIVAENQTDNNSEQVDKLMQIIISLRNEAKNNKDFNTSDNIRNLLAGVNITLKDTKEGTEWIINN